jgi:hypothetical protein
LSLAYRRDVISHHVTIECLSTPDAG